ncbi:helix-turn-helix domain-containing protein [Niallia circulans]
MRKRYFSLAIMEKICIVLNCGVDEILEFITEDINRRSI